MDLGRWGTEAGQFWRGRLDEFGQRRRSLRTGGWLDVLFFGRRGEAAMLGVLLGVDLNEKDWSALVAVVEPAIGTGD